MDPAESVMDLNGLYTAGGQPSFDQTKPWGAGQEAPLTPEYQKVFEKSLAEQAEGGEGNFFDHAVRCMAGGMPLMTIAFSPLEFVVTPDITYVLTGNTEPDRRIYTDGREFPTDLIPTYAGYSIGRWIDEDGDGTFDTLEVETRGPFRVPAPMTQPACRCVSTTSPSSRSASSATGPIRCCCTTRSPCSTMR